jgi:hypothetical protein
MSLFFKSKAAAEADVLPSTAFSEFIRGASSAKKKQVYSKVLKRASEAQLETLGRVKRKRSAV